MLIFRNPTQSFTIADPALRSIVEQRFADMCDEDDPDVEPAPDLEPDLL